MRARRTNSASAAEQRRVVLAATTFDHLGSHSGYAQLVPQLRQVLEGTQVVESRDRPVWMPERVWFRLIGRSAMPWYGPASLGLEVAVATRVWTSGADIVHFIHGDDALRYSPRTLPPRGTRVVATFHQPPKMLDATGPPASALRRLAGAIALGSNQLDHLSELLGPERVHEARHGVDTGYFRPGHTPRDDATCLAVGQWLRDPDLLERTCEILAAQAPDVRVVVLGASDEALGRLSNVILPGRVSNEELLRRYQTASLCLMPLEDAVANNVLLEAMSCGAPLVCTDVGAVRDYADDRCAEFVPAGAAESMADAVLRLLGDSSRLEAMSAAARERALVFDWPRVVEHHVRVYRQVLETAPVTGAQRDASARH